MITGSIDEKLSDIKTDQKKLDLLVLSNGMKMKEYSDIIERIEGF
jgi:hypothetical protein